MKGSKNNIKPNKWILIFSITITLITSVLFLILSVINKENTKLKNELFVVLSKLETVEESLHNVKSYSQSLERLALENIGSIENSAGVKADLGDMNAVDFGEEEMRKYIGDEPLDMDKNEYANILDRINSITTNAEILVQQLQNLTLAFRGRDSLLAAIPAMIPTNGVITSVFGMRISPFTGEQVMHRGVDIAATKGTKIFAPSDGLVIYAKNSQGSYGKVIVVDHGFGIITKYAHTSRIHVKKGQKIKRGQLIAAVGNSGRSTGPHLHFETWIGGRVVNPFSIVKTYSANQPVLLSATAPVNVENSDEIQNKNLAKNDIQQKVDLMRLNGMGGENDPWQSFNAENDVIVPVQTTETVTPTYYFEDKVQLAILAAGMMFMGLVVIILRKKPVNRDIRLID